MHVSNPQGRFLPLFRARRSGSVWIQNWGDRQMGWYSAGYCLWTATFRMDCSVGKEVMAPTMLKVKAYAFCLSAKY